MHVSFFNLADLESVHEKALIGWMAGPFFRPFLNPNNSQSLVLHIQPREFIQEDNLFYNGLFKLIITIGFHNP